MLIVFNNDSPVYQQLSARIADDVVAGVYPEETAVPSATDFATFFQMNPATASKGVNLLVELGVLYKRRGIGIFVATGARAILLQRRRETFDEQYLRPLLHEARTIGIGRGELHTMIDERDED